MGTVYNVADDGTTRAGTTTNNVTIGDGGILLTGTARKTKKITYGVNDFSEGDSLPAFVTLSNTYGVWEFDNNRDLLFTLIMPNDYEEGTDFKFHVVWAPTDGGAGTVEWDLNYQLINDGTVIDGAATTVTSTATAPGVTDETDISPDATVSGTSVIRSSRFNAQIARPNTDTYGARAQFMALEFLYTSNQIGEDL